MYSSTLQEYIRQLGNYVQVSPDSIELLEKTLACFVATLGKAINADTEPQGDLFDTSVRLILLSDGLANLPSDEILEGAHYLVGLGFEQLVEPLVRLGVAEPDIPSYPMESDSWYGLSLALLHYLAGGYRVQALSVLRRLESISSELKDAGHEYAGQYQDSVMALGTLYSVKRSSSGFLTGINRWYDLFFNQVEPETWQETRFQKLAQLITQRRDIVLANLGENDEASWLSKRNINSAAADFWKSYLRSLDGRGITAFTKEQVGQGFDVWLRSGNDLLVVLPTGSGKTVIGELRSALALAQGQQVLWMLPTRALVRQVTRELRDALEQLRVTIEELPATEDFMPLFAGDFGQRRHIAVTTPEKLASLLRANPQGVQNVGLIVFDEAQILLKETRGTTAEFVLRKIRQQVPTCDIVLMSAFGDLQDSLKQFLTRLGRQPDLLLSDTRPTRRLYGVITNDFWRGKQVPVALLYPPGIQEEDSYTETPFKLTLSQVSLPKSISPTDMARRFVKETTKAGLRTALFVSSVVSTETQAIKMIGRQKPSIKLPERDVARLHVELGRESVVEETSTRGIACHHAGLTPLEQTIVEKWMREGTIKTIVATPTLAQGVNLPFDLSIVTYTHRRDGPVPPNEILNMIGRAGRAGHVSDGIGLISRKRYTNSGAIRVLDDARHVFFQLRGPSSEHLGLARLVTNALQANVSEQNWLVELDELGFYEAQTLVSFVLSITAEVDDAHLKLDSELRAFPSIQQLDDALIIQIVDSLEQLALNIRSELSDEDSVLLSVLRRTGMPIEILASFLSQIRSSEFQNMTGNDLMEWADLVVQTSLEACLHRGWYTKLLEDAYLQSTGLGRIFSVVSHWRLGSPLSQLETVWRLEGVSEKKNRINLGRFLNHNLSLFAQFWGALAVCYEEVFGIYEYGVSGTFMKNFPVFIRRGVLSLEQLEWLRAIGGLDRVLAHKLSETLPLSSNQIRNQVWNWRKGRQLIPRNIEEPYKMALSEALNLTH
ncbi:MAG: hypothetical protein DRJ03_25425 [Chloroflexi bacterium]|nr:MAG: hypothetical protein DRI81_13735 [Chloroflexota bacterium]RLC78330.1 MAG: hypothetical protein DRJ03_25425 [Chloroflexota bacterium]